MKCAKTLMFLLAAGMLAASGAAFGAEGAFDRAKRSYKDGSFAESAALLEKDAKARTDARSQYLLGLARLKLHRFDQAQTALEEARRLDPKIAFTSRAKFEEKLQRAQTLAKAAAAPRPTVPGRGSGEKVGAPSPRLAFAPEATDPLAPGRGNSVPAPVPRLEASASASGASATASSSGGAPTWALVLLGLCGMFLVVSLVRQLRTRAV